MLQFFRNMVNNDDDLITLPNNIMEEEEMFPKNTLWRKTTYDYQFSASSINNINN